MEKRLELLEGNLVQLTKEIGDLKDLIGSGFLKVTNNFDTVKKEIDSLHKKVDFLHKKVDALEGSTTDGFDGVGVKLDSLSDEISKIGIITKYTEEYNNLKGLN